MWRRKSSTREVDVICPFGALHRGCRDDPLGVIQRTAGATLYWDGGGAGVGAVSSRVHAPAPRWDSAPLAKIPDACMVRVLTRILEVSWLSEPTIKQTIS
jgi:hypothetical protein